MQADSLEEFSAWARTAPDLGGASLVRWVLEQPGMVRREGTWIEFGVAQGNTLAYLAGQRGRATLWGLDSFRGLPEDWNDRHPRGTFALPHPPAPPDGAQLLVGMFEDTLPSFCPDPVTFVHLDCDLYSSARTALGWLKSYSAGSCLVVLDDFFTPPHTNGVMRALLEVRSWCGRVSLVARAHDVLAIRIWD